MPQKKSKAKTPPATPAAGDRESVTRLAYELYMRRGGEAGHDVEDWLMAEQILLEQNRRPAPARRVSDAARRLEDKFRK